MWWTPRGERVLTGSEWELFRVGLSTAWDRIEDSQDDPDLFMTGLEAYDTLGPNQKLALLALVGKALKSEDEPSPNLTAHVEGTVAAVFRHIASEAASEIDMAPDLEPGEDTMFFRRLVLAADQKTGSQDDTDVSGETATLNVHEDQTDDEDDSTHWSPPNVSSKETEDWEFLVDSVVPKFLDQERS